MILRAKNFQGQLDISAPEVLGSDLTVNFRRAMRPGDIISVPDGYYVIPNIRSAISVGYLEILAYDTDVARVVTVLGFKRSQMGGAGVPGDKYIILDIHGGEDTEEIRDANGTPYLMFHAKKLGRTRWNITVPEDYQAGTNMYAEAFWSAAAAAGNVQWVMGYKGVTLGGTVVNPPTTVSLLQGLPAPGFLSTTGLSLVIPGGTVSAGDLLTVAISRDGCVDTHTGSVRMHLLRIKYTGLVFSQA